jgi:hypothetical protein
VSVRTAFSRVIPNVVRNLQLRIRRETVQDSRRFLVATLLGMTGGGLGMTGGGLGMTGGGLGMTGGGLGMTEVLLRPFYDPIFLEFQH